LEDFTDPHSTPSHQLKHQPVSRFDSAKDDLIHNFLFENGPSDEPRGSIELFQHRGITRASEIAIKILRDEIEERGELRVPGPFGCLFGVLINLGEEG
jgi:hypothetical protein